MLNTRYRGNFAQQFALLVFSFLILGLVPALAGQGKSKGNGKDDSPIQAGYAIVTPVPNDAEAGMVVFETFGERHGLETTQAGVLSTGTSDHWVLFTNSSGRLSRNLGVAIANPSIVDPANITLILRNETGQDELQTEFAVPTSSQVSKFVTELFSKQNLIDQDFNGTLDITSDIPVAVVGLRFRGANFSTLPATSIGQTVEIPKVCNPNDMADCVGGPGAVVLPQFATGGGWASEIVIINPTDKELIVRVDIFTQTGEALDATLNGETKSSFLSPTIRPHGIFVLSPGDNDF